MAQCSQFGSNFDEKTRFCVECGHPLMADNQIESPSLNIEILTKTFNELNALDFMGLQCLKCGSYSALTLFKHQETISVEHHRYTNYKTKTINIPLCINCNSDLTSWIKNHSGTKSRSSYKDVICLNLCGLAFGIGLAFTFPIVSVLIFIIMGLSYLYIIRKRSLKNQVNSPFRYIKFRGRNTYVRPRGIGEWIRYDAWLNSITQGNQFAF